MKPQPFVAIVHCIDTGGKLPLALPGPNPLNDERHCHARPDGCAGCDDSGLAQRDPLARFSPCSLAIMCLCRFFTRAV
jgi:hypothetical protein